MVRVQPVGTIMAWAACKHCWMRAEWLLPLYTSTWPNHACSRQLIANLHSRYIWRLPLWWMLLHSQIYTMTHCGICLQAGPQAACRSSAATHVCMTVSALKAQSKACMGQANSCSTVLRSSA